MFGFAGCLALIPLDVEAVVPGHSSAEPGRFAATSAAFVEREAVFVAAVVDFLAEMPQCDGSTRGSQLIRPPGLFAEA